MKLGINTGFAVNRYPLPEQWLKVVNDLGLKHVQLTADLLNPSLDPHIIADGIRRINGVRKGYGISIDSVMTGGFTRVNHFSHPDLLTQAYWRAWFKRLVDMAQALGAYEVSSHFGIMSYEDLNDPERRKRTEDRTVAAWKELAEYAAGKGIISLSWEPMSIKREYGETIQETLRIQERLAGSKIPIKICLDVAHGDASAGDPDQTDYRKWIEACGPHVGVVHLKQVMRGTSAHLPFTEENNRTGSVHADECLNLVRKHCPQDTLLLLEHAFREREPIDSQVFKQLAQSAEYWKEALK